MTWIRHYNLGCYAGLILCLHSCAIYSFSGASLSAKIKTFSVADFESNVAQGPADLADQFTEALTRELLQRTVLSHAEKEGDLQFEGTITKFEYSPATSTSSSVEGIQDEASKLRLTITLEVNYLNPHNKEFSFEKKIFTQYEDAPADSAMEEENELVKKIFTKLVKDIFNASVANW